MIAGLFIGILIASLLVALNNQFNETSSIAENKARSSIRVTACVVFIITLCMFIGYLFP